MSIVAMLPLRVSVPKRPGNANKTLEKALKTGFKTLQCTGETQDRISGNKKCFSCETDLPRRRGDPESR